MPDLPALRRSHLTVLCIAALSLAACSRPAAEGSMQPVAASAQPAPSAEQGESKAAVDPDSPCRLLKDAEVRAVLPGVHAGERDRSREKYGIAACVWTGDDGRFVAQVWKAAEGSAEDEIRGLASGFVDPLNAAASNNVRYEAVSGVGEQAFAVLETADEQRGILTDASMLVARQDDQILVLLSDDLARRDREEALGALQSLGRSAAGRL